MERLFRTPVCWHGIALFAAACLAIVLTTGTALVAQRAAEARAAGDASASGGGDEPRGGDQPGGDAAPRHADEPRCVDARLSLELVAEAPLVTTPIGLTFDSLGRLLVIESHTHFRDDTYDGPTTDRIKILHDDDGDGRFDRSTIFFEGTRYTLNLVASGDGVYVVTRGDIRLLADRDHDGKSDSDTSIVRLQTSTVDQHNGLSGLCVDPIGRKIYFGLGENYGADYKLIGSDGQTIAGGGEGGGIFSCDLNGAGLRRIATGLWNPFGVTRDSFGRILATDNDPTSRPPNRLLHIVQGGDYGFQYRYGRSGLHPFVAWNGELPGTLGMAAGIGEAACHLLRYDSDGLPADYRGDVLLASWSDHGVERYRLTESGSTFHAQKIPFVTGGIEFRPVGLVTAPDGSIYFTDWVAATYSVHHRGKIWRIRAKQPPEAQEPSAPKEPAEPIRPAEPAAALRSLDRVTRERAAILLSKDAEGLQELRKVLTEADDEAVRGTALSALVAARDSQTDLIKLASSGVPVGLRRLAVTGLAAAGGDTSSLLKLDLPAEVRAEALRGVRLPEQTPTMLDALNDKDPWIRHAATDRLGDSAAAVRSVDPSTLNAGQRLGLLLAWRHAGLDPAEAMSWALHDADEDVRFTAVKWIADRRMTDQRPSLLRGLDDASLSKRMFLAYLSAFDRVEADKVSDSPNAKFLMSRAFDATVDTPIRAMALSLLRPDAKGLAVKPLLPLLSHDSPALRREAVRLLGAMPGDSRFEPLTKVATDDTLDERTRADAVAALAPRAGQTLPLLLNLATHGTPRLRYESLRALIGVDLDNGQRQALKKIRDAQPDAAEAVARVLGEPRPSAPGSDDAAGWSRRLSGPADADAGRRIFEHPKIGACITCHVMEGRGNRVGPDLSRVGQRGNRSWLVQSILEPSREIAPQFIPWLVVSKDGQERIGFALTKARDRETYADATGQTFTVKSVDIVSTRELDVSVMPTGLLDAMTTQECRDLIAYLSERR